MTKEVYHFLEERDTIKDGDEMLREYCDDSNPDLPRRKWQWIPAMSGLIIGDSGRPYRRKHEKVA